MPNCYNYHRTDIDEKRIEPLISLQEDHQRHQALTKAKELEMGEVREENERLKSVLEHVENDYKSLQLRYFDIVKQDQQNQVVKNPNFTDSKQQKSNKRGHDHDHEEAELVSLCLGRTSPRDHEERNSIVLVENNHDHDQDLKANELSLGLGSEKDNEKSSEKSLEEDVVKELSEAPKKSTKNSNDHEASHEQSQAAKRARVSVRARCDTPTMNDGCQWRKYGQKIAKGNPCPRAYYRCTVAPSCPVRKQVQRCADDMSILITTYEGTHNHPLPVTATAMASTTSAAASMLLSGSSSIDQTSSRFTPLSTTTSSASFGHLDSTSNNNNLRPKQFHFPSNNNSSFSPVLPTITLDLTSSQFSSSSHQFMINRSSSLPSSFSRIIPSSSLSFGNSSEQINLPTLWANGSPFLGYSNNNNISNGNNNILAYSNDKNSSQIGSLDHLGRQAQELFLYQRRAEKLNNNVPVQDTLTERLTKAITADPGAFKSVIAAAISSMVGGGGADQSNLDGGVVERLSQRLTLGHEATQSGKGYWLQQASSTPTFELKKF